MKKVYKVTLMIFAALFSLWLVVTVYFYNHHTVTVKTINLAGWDLDTSETGVQWKEITFVNKVEDYDKLFAEPLFSEKQAALLNKLPTPLLEVAVTTKAFYRKPYKELKDSWNVTITGMALEDMYDNEERLIVSLEDEQGSTVASSGGSMRREDNTNIIYLGSSHENVKFDIKKLSKIQWYRDKEHPYEVELNNIAYETKKHGFFNKRPREMERIFSFYGEIRGAIIDVSKGKKVKTEWIGAETGDLLRKYKFSIRQPWYVGNHNGYTNVFGMAVEYFADDDVEYKDKIVEQQWFFVEDNEQWVLIDRLLLENI